MLSTQLVFLALAISSVRWRVRIDRLCKIPIAEVGETDPRAEAAYLY
jgi:hypothetical protein